LKPKGATQHSVVELAAFSNSLLGLKLGPVKRHYLVLRTSLHHPGQGAPQGTMTQTVSRQIVEDEGL